MSKLSIFKVVTIEMLLSLCLWAGKAKPALKIEMGLAQSERVYFISKDAGPLAIVAKQELAKAKISAVRFDKIRDLLSDSLKKANDIWELVANKSPKEQIKIIDQVIKEDQNLIKVMNSAKKTLQAHHITKFISADGDKVSSVEDLNADEIDPMTPAALSAASDYMQAGILPLMQTTRKYLLNKIDKAEFDKLTNDIEEKIEKLSADAEAKVEASRRLDEKADGDTPDDQ